jgi:hypothetical protein
MRRCLLAEQKLVIGNAERARMPTHRKSVEGENFFKHAVPSSYVIYVFLCFPMEAIKTGRGS